MVTKEFEKSKVFHLEQSVDYANNAVVSKTALKKNTGNISIFSFDKGQQLSEHTAPFDATIVVLDGSAKIIINKQPFILSKGEMIIMPANIPHAVEADEKFKMMLIMIKENVDHIQ
jgi:quercetin dioxygenase-like cupin family protein